ncbi:MAG: hypothetical protein Sapg2KO_34340 [Saprospiraceae bacterium]
MTDVTMTVEDRLSRIERSLDRIASGMDQAPVMLSMATDSIDEYIDAAKQKGIQIEDRFQDTLHLLGRLSDPKINQSLNNLLDTLEQAPGLVSMTVDSVDELVRQSNQGTVRLDDRIAGMGQLLNKLSDPKMVERLNGLITLSEQAPGLMALTVDSIDAFMIRYEQEFKDSLSFLQRDNLVFLKNVGEAMTEAQNQEPAKVGGVFGLLRALKDSGRQKALGFLMNVLKNLGNKL